MIGAKIRMTLIEAVNLSPKRILTRTGARTKVKNVKVRPRIPIIRNKRRVQRSLACGELKAKLLDLGKTASAKGAKRELKVYIIFSAAL